MTKVEYVSVKTENGQNISSTYYLPDGEAKAAVLIVSAMGVPQKYYSPFASWLTTKGYIVATFDYSGVGLSLTGSLRDSSVTITDWAHFDCAAMIKAISIKSEGKSLYWIGHSLGGQIYGLVPGTAQCQKRI